MLNSAAGHTDMPTALAGLSRALNPSPSPTKPTGRCPAQLDSPPVGAVLGVDPKFFFPFHIPYTPRAVWGQTPFFGWRRIGGAAARFWWGIGAASSH